MQNSDKYKAVTAFNKRLRLLFSPQVEPIKTNQMTKRAALFTASQSGKLANNVYYRENGKQVVKSYNPTPKNPRTYAQTKTRITLSNVTNVYKAMLRNAPMFFQFKKESQSDANAFQSLNKEQRPIYLTKSEAANGKIVMQSYLASQGSLAPLPPTVIEYNEEYDEWYVGFYLKVVNYQGSNFNSFMNSFSAAYRDYNSNDIISIVRMYEVDNVIRTAAYNISFKEKEFDSQLSFLRSGMVGLILGPQTAFHSSACAFRQSVDANKHKVASTSRFTLSATAKNIAIVYAQQFKLDEAILSYQ